MSAGHVVVVLNWHGREDTLACVRSVLDGEDTVRVLVVDNGSYDGTLAALAETHRINTLQLPRNVGFSGGMNRGVEWALDAGAETVTILNNDTVAMAGALTRLAELATHSTAVSPTVMFMSDPDRVWFGGGTVDLRDAYPHHIAATELSPCTGGVRPSEILAGCCITASAATWRAVGPFDERFFLNFEDSEWSLRATARGVRLLVACDVRILHAVSASFTGPARTLGSFYFLRNGLLFSKIVGAGSGARFRFLRRFALGGLRSAGWRERRHALVIATWSIACYSVRRFGEAPRGIRRSAARWSHQATE